VEKLINGNNALKESLLDDHPHLSRSAQKDYNAECYRIMQDKRADFTQKFESIILVENYRDRMILLAILGGIPQQVIGKLMHIKQQMISMIYRALR